MGRILALDWGTVRVGLALSDAGGVMASPYDTLPAKPIERLLQSLQRIVKDEEVERLVVGLPLNMDGSEGASAEKAQELAKLLEDNLPVPVRMLDERLTSFEAERKLREIGRKPSRDKGRVDRVAAAILLQEYLDSMKGPQSNRTFNT
jgi:putative Holliday junction resolvase